MACRSLPAHSLHLQSDGIDVSRMRCSNNNAILQINDAWTSKSHELKNGQAPIWLSVDESRLARVVARREAPHQEQEV
jgi:hypothetical protein